ncbi:MAG TPA: response regulator [Syntrophales bacterium]|nr:response regulator [Syntrophales bacterium]
MRHKILIIDDDDFLIDMYALKFNESGFEAHAALGAHAALEKLRAGFSPDILLVDIVMSKMNGFELLEKIDKGDLAPSAVKIILSNSSRRDDIERGKKFGVAGYIVKATSTPSEVIAHVRDIIRKKI